MESSSPLEHRLRVARYGQGADTRARVLDGVGVPEEQRRLVDLSEVDELWPLYISRLRDGGDACERWPADRPDHVQTRIDRLREAASGVTVVWFALYRLEPVGIEVPADALLAAGLGYLVSPAADLMLVTRDLASGICIELNHLVAGDEYELMTWGAFSP